MTKSNRSKMEGNFLFSLCCSAYLNLEIENENIEGNKILVTFI